jgi:arylsulfatase A-like enzyme
LLLSRRLVEAGVTFISVHTEAKGGSHWDTHDNNFNLLRHLMLPFLDGAVSALLEDLWQRGLYDSTLVVVMGDMGRSPRVNARAGRDHWPRCGFCFLAGGGVKAGYVHGRSDGHGAYPVDSPVTPGDICATLYRLLGVDPEMMVPDLTGRPISITHGGEPIRAVLA